MGLVELTFGSDGERGREAATEAFLKNPNSEAELKVIKTDQFFGTPELCVMGQLTKGIIAKEMVTEVKEVKSRVVGVESRYGMRPVTRVGTQVLVMLSNLKKEDLQKDDTLVFRPEVKDEDKKPKGRIIIA